MEGARIAIALVWVLFLGVATLLFLSFHECLRIRRAQSPTWSDRVGFAAIVIVIAYWLVIPLLFVKNDFIASMPIVAALGDGWLNTEPIAMFLAMALALFLRGRAKFHAFGAALLMLAVSYIVLALATE